MEPTTLETYLSNSAKHIVGDILKASFLYPKASLFMMKFEGYSKKAAQIRHTHELQQEHIPAFLMASITNACNLHCKGCFARANHTCEDESFGQTLTTESWKDIFMQAKALGISFLILLGGEPLLRKDVIEIAGDIPQILFPIFTNATLLNEEYYTLFEEKRNLIPILSIEGDQKTTDFRRGKGIYVCLQKSMLQLKEHKLLFGASITVTADNLSYVTSDSFVKELDMHGCKSVIYVEYVPVGTNDTAFALTDVLRERLNERLIFLRTNFIQILFLSFPGDEKAFGGCLAAGRGFFHINAIGGVEPCPFSPYSDTNLKDTSLLQALQSPLFHKLEESGILQEEHIGGCTLYAYDDFVSSIQK